MYKPVLFQKNLDELEALMASPIDTDRDRVDVLKAFGLTFEQAWKAIRKIASDQGVQVRNPRNAIMFAINNRWIKPNDEEDWMLLIKDVNLISHTYSQKSAQIVIEQIKSSYLKRLKQLLENLERV